MVIFYHTQRFYFDDKLNFLKGGFIGVDIFFVISGYLITRIILSDLISYKKFSIKEFYFNRIRRVVPLLFFLTFILFPIVNYLFIIVALF
jgi:peptidoglycan/LPS O-acetylase OafA/YrhL